MPKVSKYTCPDLIEDNLLCENGLACGKGFVRKGDLTRHRKIHTGIMDFTCDICHKRFQQKTQLGNHRNIHTGNAPHACDICGAKFKDPSSCCRHRKEQHEGVYVCFADNCRQSIARKCNFRKHLQGHNVYRPDMELEDHWVRHDDPRSKRFESRGRPNKKRVTTEVESPSATSSKLEMHEESYPPIKVPQLCTIDPTSSPYQAPSIHNVPLPYALPPAEQLYYKSQVGHYQTDTPPWWEPQQWESMIYNQSHCSPLSTTQSMSSSLSSSPELFYLPLYQARGSIEPHTQSPPCPPSQQRFGTISQPLETPIASYETLHLLIDRFSLSQSSIIFDPALHTQSAGAHSTFTSDLQMVA